MAVVEIARPPRDDVARAITGTARIRAAANGTGAREWVGHLAVFDEWVEIDSRFEGHFLESFAPGSFDKTIRERRARIKCLLEHGMDPQLGLRPIARILNLGEDAVGCAFETELLDGIPELVMAGLLSGEYGVSHRFSIVREEFQQRPPKSERNPKGLPERRILEARLSEFGPVAFPAYPSAEGRVRSMTDQIVMHRFAGDPDRLRALARQEGLDVVPAEEERSEREYKRTLLAVGSTPWVITKPALATIVAILGERAAGIRPSAEEIRERIGTRAEPEERASGPVKVIPVHGPMIPRASAIQESSGMVSTEMLTKEFKRAVADPEIGAIVFDISSPGGAAPLIPELASEVMRARGSKPIVAVANAAAMSGAYWFASAAEELVMSPSAQVGSVGVYVAHEDWSKHHEQEGIKTTLISAGEHKVEGNPFEPLSEEAREELQRNVDTVYGMFVGAVAEGRGISRKDVEEKFGQGRVFFAPEAIERGMADSIGTLDATIDRLSRQVAAERLASEAEQQTEAAEEPEPSEATAPPEPEPPAATTHEAAPQVSRDEFLDFLSTGRRS